MMLHTQLGKSSIRIAGSSVNVLLVESCKFDATDKVVLMIRVGNIF